MAAGPEGRDPVTVVIWRVRGDERALPAYMTEGAAGCDLEADLAESLTLAPLERCLVPTGFAIALPRGFEAQIRPRSGLALRDGITLLNAPGTIDADYRGEIKLILVNLSNEARIIRPGDRVAQLVVASVERAAWRVVAAAPAAGEALWTARGEGGFGHTGRSATGAARSTEGDS